MLTAEDLKVVLASESLRQAHGLELPQESLTALAGNPGTFAHFYEQWSAQGQPRYVPPAAQQPAQAQPMAAPPAQMAPPPPAAPDFGPPPTPRPAPQFAPFSRDPAASAFAPTAAPSAMAPSTIAPPVSPYGAAPYAGTGYLGPHAVGPNAFLSPNAVAPTGLNRPGMKMMLWGFGAAAVGVIITVVTFVAAAPGQTFVVAWGAIIFGSVRGIIGAVHLSRGS